MGNSSGKCSLCLLVGLFRVVEQFQGWEDARNHQPSKVMKPPHHRGHRVSPTSHFSQRVSSALSLLGTKRRELRRLLPFLSLAIKEVEVGI